MLKPITMNIHCNNLDIAQRVGVVTKTYLV